MRFPLVFCGLLVLALLLLNAAGHYVDRKKCWNQGGTMMQDANGPSCIRVEVIRA